MSDDEDYMSDKFLQGTEKYVPPSLIHRHADKREFELMKRKAEIEARIREKNKPIGCIEEEKREEGLASAIGSNNKGFEMLMKMGYKPGQGIGKAESGMIEPIGLEVKSNRHGLGKSLKKKEIKKNSTDSKLENTNMKDFRGRIAQRKAEQLIKTDLHRSQKACEQLDKEKNIEKPSELWFWPDNKEETESQTEMEEDNVDTDESLTDSEKLEILTKYLRKEHFYCIWCGVTYNDEDDLKSDCPGQTRNDH